MFSKNNIFRILFKFKGEFSNQKNMQQLFRTLPKLDASIDTVF